MEVILEALLERFKYEAETIIDYTHAGAYAH